MVISFMLKKSKRRKIHLKALWWEIFLETYANTMYYWGHKLKGFGPAYNNKRMIQLTDEFWVQLRYRRASNFWLQLADDSIIRDPIKRRALYLFLLTWQVSWWLDLMPGWIPWPTRTFPSAWRSPARKGVLESHLEINESIVYFEKIIL